MKEINAIRSTVCKRAAAYVKAGMNRSAAFRKAWAETATKAAELKQGDMIEVVTYSTLWMQNVTVSARVMNVSRFGSNVSVMVMAKECCKQTVKDVFLPAASLVRKIA